MLMIYFCSWCKRKLLRKSKKHEKTCYLNPINKKHCPICNNVIIDYKQNVTCSFACANTYFRSGKNNSRYINGKSLYNKICFKYHKRKCIVCDEVFVVEAHHYDNNKENNTPENLIPLCPTHHKYCHSKYKYLIINKIIKFRNNFIKARNKL